MNDCNICLTWAEDGNTRESRFTTEVDDWQKQVRAEELKALASCDDKDDVTVFAVSDDGVDGFWIWNESSLSYEYSELG